MTSATGADTFRALRAVGALPRRCGGGAVHEARRGERRRDRSRRLERERDTDSASENLGERIARARGALEEAPGPNIAARYNAASLAWRMTIELVAGVAVGFAIGYGLDRLFGTMPAMLIVFGLLGFAAGIKVLMGTAREARERQQNDGPPGV